jgi:hypothetical protein
MAAVNKLSDYNDFADAISQLTTAGVPAILVIDVASNYSTTINVPDYVLLRHFGWKLTRTGAGEINFLGIGLENPLSDIPLFANIALPKITFLSANRRKVESIDIANNTIKITNHNYLEHLGVSFTFATTVTPFSYNLAGTQIIGRETRYYARNIIGHTFQLSLTPTGDILDLNGIGNGQIYANHQFSGYSLNSADGAVVIVGHGWAVNDKVEYFTHHTPMQHLIKGNFYYVNDVGSYYFRLSDTPGGARKIITDEGVYGSVHYFIKRSIRFKGDSYPQKVSLNLFDTGDEFLQDRLALTSGAFAGKKVTILGTGRTINSNQADLLEEHTFDGQYNEFPNNFVLDALNPKSPIRAFPNFKIHNAIFHESSDGFSGVIVAVFDLNGDTGSIELKNIETKPGGVGFAAESNQSNYELGNCSKGALLSDLKWERTHSYGVKIGGNGVNGFRATNVYIERLYYENCYHQPFFIANADGVYGDDIFFKHTSDGINSNADIDIEPNDGDFDLVRRIRFNRFRHESFAPLYRPGTSDLNVCYGVIGLQAPRTGIEDVEITNSSFISNSVTFTFIGGYGVSKLKLRNVELSGARDSACTFYNCSDIEIENIKIGDIGIGTENAYRYILRFGGCRNTKVDGVYLKNSDLSLALNDRIFEHEFGMFVSSSSGSQLFLTELGGTDDVRGFTMPTPEKVWKYGAIKYNTEDYAIESINPHSFNYILRSLSVIGSVPEIGTTIATFDYATGYFTSTTGNHNLVRGAAVGLVNESYLTDGAEYPLPAHTGHPPEISMDKPSVNGFYYAIPHPTDLLKLKLAHTLADAMSGTNGIPINFTDNGSGNYALMPAVQTNFSSSSYKNIEAGEVVLKGTSILNPISPPIYGTPIRINVGGSGVTGWQDNTFVVDGNAGATYVTPVVSGVVGAAPAAIYTTANSVNPTTGAVKNKITGLVPNGVIDVVFHTVNQSIFSGYLETLIAGGHIAAYKSYRHGRAGTVPGKALVTRIRASANEFGELMTKSLAPGFYPILCGIELYPLL